MSNFLVHGIVNTLIYLLVLVIFLMPFEGGTWILVVIAGNILDVDHVPYFLIHFGPFNVQNIKKVLEEDYAGKIPHFYLFHTLEFELVLVIFANIFWTEAWVSWILFSWSFHLLTDLVCYLQYYRSFNPWGKFWVATYYFTRGKPKKVISSRS